ncbi:MAG: 4Fe-4S binding protein [Anaerolineales bacterium]|nr:4Fe-4S binding protein [Chloroflexota bacterium]MBL6980652.1 4Fe-4S binding protein [Anaerolineales bacterium]
MPRKPLLGLLLPSTRAFMKEARRLTDFSLLDRLHGFVYLHWLYQYIGLGTKNPTLARILKPLNRFITHKTEDDNKAKIAPGYHGKVMPLEAASQLVSVQEDIEIRDLEHIVPYKKARDIVLKNPDHIIALECPCRSSQSEPCLPLDVCLVVGEPFATMVLEHHPDRTRKITSSEAQGILQAEQERGHVSHAYFKDAMLGRFYAICNCCACCCKAMQIHRGGDPMICSSGYIAVIDEDMCISCGNCEDVCQFDAITMSDYAEVDFEACMGCGVCVAHCDGDAAKLELDPAKGEPLIIQELMAELELKKA